jgi:hypothetical protein
VHTDFLFIVAEIAAAFAGFASLAAAIATRQEQTLDQARLDFRTLQNVLVLSLLTIAFSLVPSAIARQGIEAPTAWRVCAAAFCVAKASYLAYFLPQILTAYRSLGRRAPISFVANACLAAGSCIVLGACAAGMLPPSSYLLSLIVLLYLAGFGFIRFFISMGRSLGAA